MDEPFGALDALTRQLMQELLTSVWEQHRLTVLFVTHDVEEAVFISDRVVIMTNRPGRMKKEVRVDAPPAAQPRDARISRIREALRGGAREHSRGEHRAARLRRGVRVIAPLTADGRPLATDYALALAHEHVFIDIRCWLDETHEPDAAPPRAAVDEETVDQVRGNPFACLDNLVLDDMDRDAGGAGVAAGAGADADRRRDAGERRARLGAPARSSPPSWGSTSSTAVAATSPNRAPRTTS